MEKVVRRHGPLIVVVARFVVVLRQLNGIVAGTTGMPWPTFLLANALGAALWVGVWTTVAYKFGHSTDIIPFIWHHLSAAMAIGMPLLVAGLADPPPPPARVGPELGSPDNLSEHRFENIGLFPMTEPLEHRFPAPEPVGGGPATGCRCARSAAPPRRTVAHPLRHVRDPWPFPDNAARSAP